VPVRSGAAERQALPLLDRSRPQFPSKLVYGTWLKKLFATQVNSSSHETTVRSGAWLGFVVHFIRKPE